MGFINQLITVGAHIVEKGKSCVSYWKTNSRKETKIMVADVHRQFYYVLLSGSLATKHDS